MILKLREQITTIQKTWHPDTENPTDSTNGIDITELQQIEAALLKSEEKFSKAFRSNPNIAAITTLKNGKYLEVNDAFIRTTGYTREEAIGRNSVKLGWAKAEDRDRMLKILREQGRVNSEEFEIRGKLGEIRTCLFSAEPIDFGGEPCIITVATDITELKRAEEALRENEEFTSSLLENAPYPIAVTYPDTSIKYVNPAFVKMTGFDLAEITGIKAPYPWWPEEGQQQHTRDFEKAMRQGAQRGVNRLERCFQRKNGERHWVEITAIPVIHNGKFKYHLSNLVDITERKQAEVALRESEEKYRVIFEQASDSILLIDHETKKIVDFNDRVCQNLGYDREEFFKLKITDIDAMEVGLVEEEIKKHHEETQKGIIDTFETQHRTKSGEIQDVLVKTRLLDVGGKKLSLSIWSDITERKRIEEALRESEEFTSSLLENSPNPISVINTDTSIKYVNPAFEKMTGFSPAEITGIKAPYPYWAEEQKQSNADFEEVMRQGAQRGVNRLERCFQRKNGERYWVEITGIPIIHDGKFKYHLSNLVDITERKQAEEALRESEGKYRDLLDNTNDLIQSVIPDGRFRYVNNGWRQTLGYSEEEISNLTIFDILHPDCSQHYKMLFQKMKFGEDMGRINLAFISKNGGKILVEGNVTGKYANGELIYTRGIFRDITENKQLEEQMFRLSSAVSMSTDSIVITDFDARIIDVNHKILEIYGAESKEELIGRHFLELIVPAERTTVNMDVAEIIEKGSLESREYNILSKQGHEITMQMSTSLVRNADGKPMGMVRVGRQLGKPR